jgi:hypothetical protein
LILSERRNRQDVRRCQIFKIMDANGQSLAYVYGHADPRDAQVANALTLDEARRIASNIAKLPALLGKGG